MHAFSSYVHAFNALIEVCIVCDTGAYLTSEVSLASACCHLRMACRQSTS